MAPRNEAPPAAPFSPRADAASVRAVARRAWRRLITGDADVRIRDHIRLQAKRPRVIRVADKAAFTTGVLLTVLTTVVFAAAPQRFPAYYTVLVVALLALRGYLYVRKSYGYFLLDFCYFCNVLALATLHVPGLGGPAMRQAVFALANGPLLLAILAWRCSLVFHSVDKMVTFFIHFLAPLATWAIRWAPPPAPATCAAPATTDAPTPLPMSLSTWASGTVTAAAAAARSLLAPPPSLPPPLPAAAVTPEPGTAWGLFWLPVMLYAAWQAAYLLKTEVIDASHLRRHLELGTSLRWIARDGRNGLHSAARWALRRTGLLRPGEGFDPTGESLGTKATFVTGQLVYTLIALAPAPLLFASRGAHAAALAAVFGWAVWLGGGYYVDVFATRYATKFEGLLESSADVPPGPARPGAPPADPGGSDGSDACGGAGGGWASSDSWEKTEAESGPLLAAAPAAGGRARRATRGRATAAVD